MIPWLKLSKNVYRKEILPVGQYRKDSEDLDFEITLDALKHIRNTTKDMLKAGVKIPLVKSHEGDSAFGQIVDFGINDEETSSFVDIEFSNDDRMEEARQNDISAFIPPEFVDGKGNAWKRPLRHVAITPYPVIPGLGKWESVAASFHDTKIRRVPMLEDLTETLALEFEAGENEETKQKAVVEAVATLAEQSLELAEQLKGFKDAERAKKKKTPIEYPESVVLSFGRNRAREISDLVKQSKITAAVGTALAEKYCTKAEVALSLSEEGSSEFDDLVRILSKNTSVPMSGRVDPATIKLSHGNGASPMVAAAKRRAEEAKS